MTNGLKENILGLLGALIVFFLLYLGLKWPLLLAGPLSIATFFGLYILSKPKLMVGDVEIEKLANGLELKELYDQSRRSVIYMEELAKKVPDKTIGQKALSLSQTGQDILRYLGKNPRELSQSRHFLDYYIKTSNKILENYIELGEAHVSEAKLRLVTDKTNESLDLLKEVFAKQRDSYHKEALMELEVETELLEKTIRLGGDMK